MCPQGAARIRLRRCKGCGLYDLGTQACGFFSTRGGGERQGSKVKKSESKCMRVSARDRVSAARTTRKVKKVKSEKVKKGKRGKQLV